MNACLSRVVGGEVTLVAMLAGSGGDEKARVWDSAVTITNTTEDHVCLSLMHSRQYSGLKKAYLREDDAHCEALAIGARVLSLA